MSISCYICYELFDDNSRICDTFCGHQYHEQCIEQWLSGGHKLCPLCKQIVIEANGEKKYHRVYPKFVAECSLACENNVTHLQQQIAECREKISELEKQEGRKVQLEGRVISLRTQLLKCSQKFDKLEVLLAESKSEINNKNTNILEVSEENKILRNKYSEVAEEVKVLQAKLQQAEAEKSSLSSTASAPVFEDEVQLIDLTPKGRMDESQPNGFTCEPCDKAFRDKRDLKRHYGTKVHKDMIKIPCTICGDLQWPKNLKRHISRRHKTTN